MCDVCKAYILVVGIEAVPALRWRPEFIIRGREKIPYGRHFE